MADDMQMTDTSVGSGAYDEATEEVAGEKTFTQEEVNKMIADRVSKEKSRAQRALEQAKEEARADAERLANLSQKDRESEENERLKQELEASKAKLLRLELESDTVEYLKEEDLPIEFKSFLIAENAEATLENIQAFKPLFNDAVQAEVEKRLKGHTPKGSNTVMAKVEKKDSQTELADYAGGQRVI